MYPLSLLSSSQGHPIQVELKNGETFNGNLQMCDFWMNLHLKEVIFTSSDGQKFYRLPEAYIRGNTVKYIRVPDEVINLVQEDQLKKEERRAQSKGGRGRGRGPQGGRFQGDQNGQRGGRGGGRSGGRIGGRGLGRG